MSITKTATLLHTFITIILSYSVVMFWSSSSLLLSVSTPGSTSFAQSSNCPFTGSLSVSLKNAKLKWVKMQNFRKIKKLWCREICEPQSHEINVLRKFHVIRYLQLKKNKTRQKTKQNKTKSKKKEKRKENNRVQALGTFNCRKQKKISCNSYQLYSF